MPSCYTWVAATEAAIRSNVNVIMVIDNPGHSNIKRDKGPNKADTREL